MYQSQPDLTCCIARLNVSGFDTVVEPLYKAQDNSHASYSQYCHQRPCAQFCITTFSQ